MLFGNERRINGFRRRRLSEPALHLAALVVVQIEATGQVRNKGSLCWANGEVHPSKRAHEPEEQQPLIPGQFKQGIPPLIRGSPTPGIRRRLTDRALSCRPPCTARILRRAA